MDGSGNIIYDTDNPDVISYQDHPFADLIFSEETGTEKSQYNGVEMLLDSRASTIHYGNDYGIKIFNQIGQGTRVRVTLPCVR